MKRALLIALSAAAFSSPLNAAAGDQTRNADTVLMSDNPGALALQEKWGFSDAVIAGDTIYLSGIVAGARAGDEGLEPAYERVYRRIGAVLARAGASWDDVVDMTSFHSDVEGQIEAMAAVHKRHVKAPYPAWTAIGVARILGNGLTEIKVTARRTARARQ
jgi:enamine deaminase RidA (YjgF/YER057c/UK114 family)